MGYQAGRYPPVQRVSWVRLILPEGWDLSSTRAQSTGSGDG
jgi:hypothetical protein